MDDLKVFSAPHYLLIKAFFDTLSHNLTFFKNYNYLFRCGTVTLELSSCVFEIPNDAYYTTRSQTLIGCSALSQEYCRLIRRY